MEQPKLNVGLTELSGYGAHEIENSNIILGGKLDCSWKFWKITKNL